MSSIHLDCDAPKKWSRNELDAVFYETAGRRESLFMREIRHEIKVVVGTYLSPGEVIKMLEALADALGYEIKKVNPHYQATKKVK